MRAALLVALLLAGCGPITFAVACLDGGTAHDAAPPRSSLPAIRLMSVGDSNSAAGQFGTPGVYRTALETAISSTWRVQFDGMFRDPGIPTPSALTSHAYSAVSGARIANVDYSDGRITAYGLAAPSTRLPTPGPDPLHTGVEGPHVDTFFLESPSTQVVILQAGFNDVMDAGSVLRVLNPPEGNLAAGGVVPPIEVRLGYLVDQIREDCVDCRVIVVDLFEIGLTAQDPQSIGVLVEKRLNDAIPSLVAARAPCVSAVSVHDLITLADKAGHDGLHLGQQGYDKEGAAIAKAVLALPRNADGTIEACL